MFSRKNFKEETEEERLTRIFHRDVYVCYTIAIIIYLTAFYFSRVGTGLPLETEDKIAAVMALSIIFLTTYPFGIYHALFDMVCSIKKAGILHCIKKVLRVISSDKNSDK